jgi:2-hydroxychromene-2-carboxylate isomerase
VAAIDTHDSTSLGTAKNHAARPDGALPLSKGADFFGLVPVRKSGEVMVPGAIHFYFDYISPNAYLAWTQLPALAERYGFTVQPVPVLFAGLLEAHGQLGPAEMPAKSLWMNRNLTRKALHLGVPLNPPAFHPFNPLLALRVSSLPLETPARSGLINALFQAVWVRGLHVAEPEVVADVADEIGLGGPGLVTDAGSPESKTRLRHQTDAAIASGVFGVPSMEVAGEVFWGYDDFPYLEMVLAGRDPVDPAQWQRLGRPPRASAMRRRFRT